MNKSLNFQRELGGGKNEDPPVEGCGYVLEQDIKRNMPGQRT